MNILAIDLEAKRNAVKTTLLKREGKTWHRIEVNRIVNALRTEVSEHPKHPEYLIVYGHFTKTQILEAILGGQTFTCTQLTGTKDHPFHAGYTI